MVTSVGTFIVPSIDSFINKMGKFGHNTFGKTAQKKVSAIMAGPRVAAFKNPCIMLKHFSTAMG